MGNSPYATFTEQQQNKIMQVRTEIEGWTDYLIWFKNIALSAPDNITYVEIGAHKGQSVLALADCLASFSRSGYITAVSPCQSRCLTGQLEIEENLKNCPIYTKIVPGSPLEIAKTYQDESSDLIFMDAALQYDSLFAELEAWWPKVKPGGLFAGHDFLDSGWVDVAPTVKRWARMHRLTLHFEAPHVWWVEKPGAGGWFRKTMWVVDVKMPHDHALNPAIARDPVSKKLVFAFRTTSWGWSMGRIWVATLNEMTMELEHVPDLLRLGPEGLNYEDPRLFVHQGTLWLAATVTDFSHGVINRLGIAPLERFEDGWDIARELMIIEPEKPVRQEKNWIFFERNAELQWIYSMRPWVVKTNRRKQVTLLEHPGLPWNYGQARGGSQFFEAPNGMWWAFFHSSDSKQYYAGLVEVDPETMIPLRMTHEPLLPDEIYPLSWNSYRVLWVAGAVVIGDEVLISFGINDDACHLRLLSISDLESTLFPLDAMQESRVPF
jgi:predicted GH43/DUF377 family glycosyl hydrolase